MDGLYKPNKLLQNPVVHISTQAVLLLIHFTFAYRLRISFTYHSMWCVKWISCGSLIELD